MERSLLRVRGLHVAYGRALALRGVDLDVAAGEVVAVLGPNGAGKTTLLRALGGLLPFVEGRVTGGSVELEGRSVGGLPAAAIVRRGVGQVLEGRHLFASLTVEENLEVGVHSLRRSERRAAVERVLGELPLLAGRRSSPAGSLSGGQQQLLAIGLAVARSPRLLLLDEPTLGLAPKMADTVMAFVATLPPLGTAVLLVEPHASVALAVADSAVVLSAGECVAAGPVSEIREHDWLHRAYLGSGGR